MRKGRQMVLLCIAAMLFCTALCFPKEAKAQTEQVTIETGREIYYHQYSTNLFYINGNVGYCLQPAKETPADGIYAGEVLQNNEVLAKAIYFSTGQPGEAVVGEGFWQIPDPEISGVVSWDERYAYSHMFLSWIFADYDFDVRYRNKNCDVIYVSPAHMTKWGDIMPVSRRLELVNYSAAHGSLVIEDDFENEFVYLQKPTPSLFGLAGGQNVVYLGTFSRLLLPSIRISFMVLPPELSALYRKKADQYNQTASKAEQIALCQFIRDGHLAAQTRKLKRLYSVKLKALRSAVREVFGKDSQIQTGAAGTSLALTLSTTLTWQELQKKAQTNGLRLQLLREAPGKITLILSCSSMPVADFVPACKLLKDISQIQN